MACHWPTSRKAFNVFGRWSNKSPSSNTHGAVLRAFLCAEEVQVWRRAVRGRAAVPQLVRVIVTHRERHGLQVRRLPFASLADHEARVALESRNEALRALDALLPR
eukprot:9500132-Pyramimonas_sp.AAC.1